jgi:hypothetical protein
VIEVSVVCDPPLCMLKNRSFKCNTTTIAKTRKAARKAGWKSTGAAAPNQDLCPECFKKRGKK